VAAGFLATSPLTRLASIPLYSVTGLEQRLKQSLDHGRDVLRSFGYYAGRVSGAITPPDYAPGREEAPRPQYNGPDILSLVTFGIVEIGQYGPAYAVRVTFEPGSLYRTGKSSILPASDAAAKTGEAAGPEFSPAPSPPQAWPGPAEAPQLPRSLADVGLSRGSPAEAAAITAAVDRIQDAFRNRGYPFARIASARHVLDHGTRELESEVRVLSGEYALMGDLELRGGSGIKRSYLDYLVTWEQGEPWNQDKVEAFRESLRGSGLFQSIGLEPAGEADAAGRRNVAADLVTAPARTVGGALKYDTSFGAGVQGFWEHRNLTGQGDSLRVDLPVWQDMQELSAKYRLPFFRSPKQDFIAQGGILNQDTDAYELQSGRIAAGIERRINRRWTGTAMAAFEAGSIKDPEKPRRDYHMLGFPLGAAWSDANSLLDATRGSRVMFSVAPYAGRYEGDFNAVRTRVDAFTYLPLAGKDTLVLALHGGAGAVFGADSGEVPPAVRFYGGGGGSVRGYDYQSLGPRNNRKDPLGGSSVLEVSVDPRWKITESLGLVAFVDGGMVYDNTPDFEFGKGMRWGAGLGFRFYTAIGPLRFDVATPLTPRKDDDFLQFYISIGQSF
jgi:translocation and assembly module TamA